MDEQLIRDYRRWLEAEHDGRDDDADAAFATVVGGTLPEPAVSAGFVQQTVQAVAVAAARDARRTERTRTVLVPAACAALLTIAYFGSGLLGAALSIAVVGFLDLLVGLIVRVATTVPAGADVWTVVTSLGRVAASLLTNPAVTATILAIQGVALAALLALRRVLGSDGEFR
jgi:hypothetical protein